MTDSATGAPLAVGAVGSLQSGSFADSLWHSGGAQPLLYGGSEVGTYDVSVVRPGYAPWSRTNVSVTQLGPCGNVEPVHLDALLQPAP